ncbi:unnamed protein product [Linum tenue]|uniref:Uncharacterized protein n=1 Tax=Linum tenue TaxID=586396 RepID=A0AAV0MGV6_9ROSI|nr:unnamed protein product [Linum tenue]
MIQQLAESDPNRYGTPPALKSAIDALPTVKITGEALNSEMNQCIAVSPTSPLALSYYQKKQSTQKQRVESKKKKKKKKKKDTTQKRETSSLFSASSLDNAYFGGSYYWFNSDCKEGREVDEDRMDYRCMPLDCSPFVNLKIKQ